MADEADPKPPKRRSRLAVLAVVGIGVVLAVGLGGAWALGLLNGGDERVAAEVATTAAEETTAAPDEDRKAGATRPTHEPIFVDLPQLLVNLASDGGGTRFLKLSLAVEVDERATADRIDRLAPRIVDSFHLYLRTLQPDELRGPGSMFRLKEDLHVRIHQAIEPAEVRDVLFKEMLVQ
jgi:flagellar FliL protein